MQNKRLAWSYFRQTFLNYMFDCDHNFFCMLIVCEIVFWWFRLEGVCVCMWKKASSSHPPKMCLRYEIFCYACYQSLIKSTFFQLLTEFCFNVSISHYYYRSSNWCNVSYQFLCLSNLYLYYWTGFLDVNPVKLLNIKEL